MEPIRDGLICWLESADLNLNSTIWRDRTGNVEAELINFDSDFKQDNYLITKKNENYVKVYDNFNFLNKTITIALKKGDISKNSGIFGYWQGKNFFITGYPSQEKWGFIPNGETINIVSVDRPLDYVVLTVTISSKGKVCIYHDSKKMIESEENTITITNPLHFFKKHDAPANGTDAKTGMILVYDRVLTEEEIVHNSTYEKLKNKAYINSNNLPKLVEKLTDASNIKISNNKYGNRVQTVIDKIVDKADNITKAINQEVINDSHTFKVGTGNNVNVSSDVQDSFSPISLKGNTYQNLIQNDNNNEVIPNEIITTEKDTIQTFKVNDGEINLKIEGQTYQNLVDENNVKLGNYSYNAGTGEYSLTNPEINKWNELRIGYTRPVYDGEKLLIRVNIIKNTIVTTSAQSLKIAFSGDNNVGQEAINISNNYTGIFEFYCNSAIASVPDNVRISTRAYTSGELVIKDIQVIPVLSNPLSYTDKTKEYVSTKSEFNYPYVLENLKANTTYTLSYEIKSSNKITTNDKTTLFRIEKVTPDSNTIVKAGFTGTVDNIYRKHNLTFDTESNTKQIKINLRNQFNASSIGLAENTLSVRNLVLLEGDYTNKAMITELPTSIDGIESVAERESKNLLDGIKWHDGMINNDNGQHLDSDVAMYSDLIDIDINTLYYTNLIDNNGNTYRCRLYKADGSYLGQGLTATSTKDMYDRRANLKGLAKIRLLILNKTVTPLPSNPVLLPNLYTEGDVNVKGTDSWLLVKKTVAVKPNTKYKISLDVESISKGSNNYSPRVEFYFNTKETNNYLGKLPDSGSFTVTTKADTTTLIFAFVINGGTVSTTECEANFRNIGIYESDLYKVRLTNKRKNLLNISTFKPISYSTIQASIVGNIITVKGLKTADVEAYTDPTACNLKVYLEEGKTYSVSFKSDGKFGVRNGEDTVEIFFMLDGTTTNYFNVAGERTVTIPRGFSGYYYIRFDVNSGDKTHKFWDIQVEEGDTVTDYEPYFEPTTTEIPLPQPLRSLPNGVRDTIEGNKLVQRVGVSEFDGSTDEEWKFESLNKNENGLLNIYIATHNVVVKEQSEQALICDKFPQQKSSIANTTTEGVLINNQKRIWLRLYQTNATTVDEAKNYLSTNPITVYYELATPIEHELNIPQMFEEYSTNIITTSNNIKPNFNIESKGYEYKALIKPSTQYTLMLNAKDGNDNLDFVLGGTKITVSKTNSRNLIQTPNTLTDSNLYIGGLDTTVNNVMLLEGDLRKDENISFYFEGIVGVGEKNKNLFELDNDFYNAPATILNEKGELITKESWQKIKLLSLKPNTTYSLSYDIKCLNRVITYFDNQIVRCDYLSSGDVVAQSEITSLTKIDSSYQRAKTKFTIKEDTQVIFLIRNGSKDTLYIRNIQLEENSEVEEYIPYNKTLINIKSESDNVFKPIIDDKFKNGTRCTVTNNNGVFVVKGTSDGTAECYTNPKYITVKVKPNTDYFYSYETTGVYDGTIGEDTVESFIYEGGTTEAKIFKIPPSGVVFNTGNMTSIGIRFDVNKDNKIHSFYNIQLTEVLNKNYYTPYKEYKTQILLDEPLMRLPSGVHDEITRDGKLIRRIGKIVATSTSIPWAGSLYSVGDDTRMTYVAHGSLNDIKHISGVNNDLICDKLPVGNLTAENSNYNIMVYGHSATNKELRIAVPKTLLPNGTVKEFKEWLDANPVTIYYELSTPIVTELPAPSLRIFKDGHLTFNTLVAPESSHVIQLNKSGQIQNTIKESQSLDNRINVLENNYDTLMLSTMSRLNDLELNYTLK